MRYLGFVIAVLLAFLNTACKKVTIVVTDVPSNTPVPARIFITGNFNYWDPGDQNFMLKMSADSNYFIELPVGWGTLEYKFTRGDWSTPEEDLCGHFIGNRLLSSSSSDTIVTSIESWEDLGPVNCDKVTFLVKAPISTKPTDKVFLSGSFNEWNPANPAYELKRNSKGLFQISLTKIDNSLLQYKFTRGSWATEELDEYGNKILDRTFAFGKTDTLLHTIPFWKDNISVRSNYSIIILNVPYTTPAGSEVYLSGTFNNWRAKDKKYKMIDIGNHQFAFKLQRINNKPLEFKFIRGDWPTVECDAQGRTVDNRLISVGLRDTVKMSVQQWSDLITN